MINKRIHPVIPQQGSLGASGDLAPLAHLVLVLIGEGFVHGKEGKTLEAAPVLMYQHIAPIVLQATEGLALITGAQAIVAMGVANSVHAEQRAYDTHVVVARTLEDM